MGVDALWLRLNVDWFLADWLIPLSAEAKLCWIHMLCYCKTHGNRRGDVPAKSSLAFSRLAGIGEESVEQCKAAAKRGDEKGPSLLERDGIWSFVNWERYQSPDAERMRRMRDLSVTDRNCSVVLSRDSNSDSDSIKKPPSEVKKAASQARPSLKECLEYFQEKGGSAIEAEKFFLHYEANGWVQGRGKPIKNWKMAGSGWMIRAKEYTPEPGTSKVSGTDVKYLDPSQVEFPEARL